MGTVISRTASADDILRDAELAHEKGAALGSRTQEIVDLRLGRILGLIAALVIDRRALAETLLSLRATRDVAVAHASAVVAECYDVLWNRVGRPALDSQLDLLFPGGASAYIDGPVESFADRLGVLVDLLGRGLHPRISAELATEWSAKISAQRTAIAAAVSAHSGPAVHDQMLERVYYALVRGLQAGLAATKRDLKSEGMNEAHIHEIIPDRPRSGAKRKPPTTTGSAVEAHPAVTNGAGAGPRGGGSPPVTA